MRSYPRNTGPAPSPARRRFLRHLVIGAAAATVMPRAFGALPKAKITKVNIYRPPNLNLHFNQSNMVVTIETDQAGLIGVGEGGARDTIEQCAQRLIGQNRTLPEHISEGLDFRRGKIWPNGRPGLGVTPNLERLALVAAITDPGTTRPIYFRADGSQSSW